MPREMRRSRDEKDDLRRSFEQSQRGGSSWMSILINPPLPLWICKPGDHSIDIHRYVVGKLDPKKEEGSYAHTCQVEVHTQVGADGNDNWVCLSQYRKKCPICEDRQRLRDKGADDDVWKKLYPKTRNIYQTTVYDSREEYDKSPFLWDVAYARMEKQLGIISRSVAIPGRESTEQYIYYPMHTRKDGRTIVFTVNKGGSGGFDEYIGHRLVERADDVNRRILKKLIPIDNFLLIPSYEQVYESYFAGESPKQKYEKQMDEKGNALDFDWDDLFDELEEMSPRELLRYAKKYGVDVEIDPDDDPEDIADEIIDEMKEKGIVPIGSSQKSAKGQKKFAGRCPFGHIFGKDHDLESECAEKCSEKDWSECLKEKRSVSSGNQKSSQRSLRHGR